MGGDIRSFFKKPASATSTRLKRSLVIESSDEEDAEPIITTVKTKEVDDDIEVVSRKSTDPSVFFNTKKVKRSDESRVTKKVVEIADDYDNDDGINDEDMMMLLDAEEAAAKLVPASSVAQSANKRKADAIIMKSPLKSSLSKSLEVSPIQAKPEVTKIKTPIKAEIIKAKSPSKAENKTPSKAEIVKSKSPVKPEAKVAVKASPVEKMDAKTGYQLFLANKNKSSEIVRVARPPPVGAPDCLNGMIFLFTGELISIGREEAEDIVKSYGGKIMKSVSKKLSYMVVGVENVGPAKIIKAAELKVKTMTEDEFYDLVNSTAPESTKEVKKVLNVKSEVKPKVEAKVAVKKTSKGKEVLGNPAEGLWTVKYKPEKTKDGKEKGVLLSGPPGIGKTSLAHLVCKIEGYEVIEFNASDVRSKKALQELVQESTLSHFSFQGTTKKVQRVIIMDEVDGMSAGDRGGSTELIQMIKASKVPIICICNDHGSPKVKALAGHCLDLKFRRATAQMVEKRVLEIAKNEALSVESNVVGQLVGSTGGDIRQILNLLQLFSLQSDTIRYDQSKQISTKNLTSSPFDIIGKLLNVTAFRGMSIDQKVELYFQDYSLIPLFVQDNYIKTKPSLASGNALETLKLLSQASESISDGDLISTVQQRENAWSLLPLHAVMSTVRPCFFMHGSFQSQFFFPSWFGQNSKQGKYQRLLTGIQAKLRMATLADKMQVLMYYIPLLTTYLTKPLVERDADGIEEVMERMDAYYLDRLDWDAIQEFSLSTPPSASINAKTKAAFTRTYNKTSHNNPFSDQSVTKVGKAKKVIVESEDVMEEEYESESEVEVVKVAVKKAPAKKAAVKKAKVAPKKK